MKCIIDAQLPYRLAEFLLERGWDVVHTDDLPHKERTPDEDIRSLSVMEQRIVISKDTDFLNSYLVRNTPPKLLLITTGNIRNPELLALFQKQFKTIANLFESCSLIELNNAEIIVHE